MNSDTYHWGGDEGGLELGLRVQPSEIRTGEAINVQLAVRNRSPGALAIAPQISLFVQRGGVADEHGGGPRFTQDLRIEAGETLDLLAWRLTEEQLGADPGTRVLYAVYRPREGGEIRSGEVCVEVIA